MLQNCREYRRQMFHVSGYYVRLLIAVCFVVLFAGCDQQDRIYRGGRKEFIGSSKVSQEELRNELDNFVEFAISTINQTADAMDKTSGGVKMRKTNLLQRSRMSQAFHTMVEDDEPVAAYIELWALSDRYTNYLKHGEGSRLFGDQQEIAVAGAELIERRIEEIGTSYLEDELYDSTQRNVKAFANQNPVKGVFSNTIQFATEDKPGKPGVFEQVISIPMSPFTAMKGVDRTASAIYGVQKSMDGVSDVVDGLPESARWQMLLFLLEAQEIETVKAFSEDMSRISENTAKFTELVEKLPEDMRKESAIFIKEIDERQKNLQATIDKANEAAEAVEKSLKQGQETAKAIDAAVVNINDMAKHWEKAASATNEAVLALGSLKGEPDSKGRPLEETLGDIKTIAADVTVAAGDIKVITAKLNELAESQAMAACVADIDSLTGKITKRIILLAAMLFAMAFVYKFAVCRWAVKK